jgi:rubredoxin
MILEEERGMLDRIDEPKDGYVSFTSAGTRATGQYRCSDCGYGITIHAALPACPMCGGRTWEEMPWSPVSNSKSFRSPAANL